MHLNRRLSVATNEIGETSLWFVDDLDHQRWVAAELVVLIGESVQRQNATGDRISGYNVPADDLQQQITEKLHIRHVPGCCVVGQHGR